MGLVEEPPIVSLRPPTATDVLAQGAGALVDHLTRSIQRLRLLHQLLDADPTDVEARRILGSEFEQASNALAIAQSFDNSIRQLDDGPVTAPSMLTDEVIAENIATWVRSIDDAHRLVIADLTAVDALATSLPHLDAPSETSQGVAAELIAALVRNAIDRLDVAHPSLDQ